MIAINVLKDAQDKIAAQTGKRRKIRCFFSEKDAKAYEQMTAAVAKFNRPDEGFEMKTFHGEFVDTVDEVRKFVGRAFSSSNPPLTEYPFTKIAPLFAPSKCEALINFMYGHISRFLAYLRTRRSSLR